MRFAKDYLLKSLRAVLMKPDESRNASDFFVLGLWLLRILTFAFGLYQVLFGERFIGIGIIICAAFLVSPAVFTKNKITDIPLELEFILFITVVIQYVIGEAQDFYDSVPYYDKFVHFFLPFFISFIGFSITYTLYFTERLKVAVGTMVIFTILLTVGIGALWEIVEFSSDEYLIHFFKDLPQAQGSLTEDPLHDTMNDLIADTLGGVVGALIAARYVFRKSKPNQRQKELLREIDRHFLGNRKSTRGS